MVKCFSGKPRLGRKMVVQGCFPGEVSKKKTTPFPKVVLMRAGNGIRTRDPQLGKLMLYQLSYSRKEFRLQM
jgi:hypothetical protein